MAIRKIIQIDEEKCTGCGQCIIDCAEGAMEIIDGKAKVVKDSLCDGLGACIGGCPEGALEIIERDAPEFNEEEVEQRLEQLKKEDASKTMECGCAGSMLRTFSPVTDLKEMGSQDAAPARSELAQWPIQLRLLPPSGSLYEDKDLILIADCVAVAFPGLHQKLVKGNTIVLTCPKLDNAQESIEKLSHIFQNPINSLSVAIMEVPCCMGLVKIAEEAVKKSEKAQAFNVIRIGIKGDVLEEYSVG